MAEDNKWIRGAAWAFGIVAPILIAGLAAYNSAVLNHIQREHDDITQRVVVVEGVISGLVQSTAKTVQHIELHNAEKNHWISRIEENSRAISSLAKDSSARPDPYTGTDGRRDKSEVMAEINALKKEVRDNERRIDQVELMCARITK